ncbi:hypothetical protein M8C21_024636, partial [Ambrosia artemisiifolia]
EKERNLVKERIRNEGVAKKGVKAEKGKRKVNKDDLRENVKRCRKTKARSQDVVRVRTSPNKLYEAVDTDKMRININKGYLDVNIESIRMLLGVPSGGVELSLVAKPDGRNPILVDWKKRYPGATVSREQLLSKIIEDDTKDELMFKLDFVLLFISTMVTYNRNGTCMYTLLDWLHLDKEIKDHDWCKFIFDNIKCCKDVWEPNSPDYYINGLFIVLTTDLLYLDRVACEGVKIERSVAPISYWTKTLLSKRETMETSKGEFGMGDIRELCADVRDYDIETDEEVDEIMKEENVCVNKSLEGKLEFTIVDAMNDFPNNKELAPFIEKCRSLFSNFVVVGSQSINLGKQTGSTRHDTQREGGNAKGKGTSDLEQGNIGVQRTKLFDTPLGTNKRNLFSLADVFSSKDRAPVGKVFAVEKEPPPFETPIRKNSGSNVSERSENEMLLLKHLVVTAQKYGYTEKEVVIKRTEDIPSFSLGLTQEFPIAQEWADRVVRDARPGMEPTAYVRRGKRQIKPSVPGCSPYYIRAVDLEKNLNTEEKVLWNYLIEGVVDKGVQHKGKVLEANVKGKQADAGAKTIAEHNLIKRTMQGDIFVKKNGATLNHYLLIDVMPGQELNAGIVNCFACVLNADESKRRPGSLARLFCSTESVDMLNNESYDDGVRMGKFKENLLVCLEGNEDGLLLQDYGVKLHRLKNVAIVVIDNMDPSVSPITLMDNEQFRLKTTLYKVKDVVAKYLMAIGHPNIYKIVATVPYRLELSYATVDNVKDCGVFLMRHMETWMGITEERWHCGFPNDKKKQKTKLSLLRKRYAARIMSSDANVERDRIFEEAYELEKLKKMKII